jgi:hypothetical protein
LPSHQLVFEALTIRAFRLTEYQRKAPQLE